MGFAAVIHDNENKHNKWLGNFLCVECWKTKRLVKTYPYVYKLCKTFISSDHYQNWHFLPEYRSIELMAVNSTTVTPAVKVGQVGQWYWHVHHKKLAEQLTDPLSVRIAYIKSSKGAEVDTRLHFMRPVKNPPTGGVNQAAVDKAQRVFDTAQRAYDNWGINKEQLDLARSKLDAAKAKTHPTQAQWEELHKRECFSYCPWNGQTLFPARSHGIA